jgi:hypothetical protein
MYSIYGMHRIHNCELSEKTDMCFGSWSSQEVGVPNISLTSLSFEQVDTDESPWVLGFFQTESLM